jgi:hypothetical protein
MNIRITKPDTLAYWTQTHTRSMNYSNALPESATYNWVMGSSTTDDHETIKWVCHWWTGVEFLCLSLGFNSVWYLIDISHSNYCLSRWVTWKRLYTLNQNGSLNQHCFLTPLHHNSSLTGFPLLIPYLTTYSDSLCIYISCLLLPSSLEPYICFNPFLVIL